MIPFFDSPAKVFKSNNRIYFGYSIVKKLDLEYQGIILSIRQNRSGVCYISIVI